MENYAGHKLTAVSFDASVPRPPERRIEDRQTTLLRVGKLVVAGDERLCMIRNISSAGAMLRLYRPIALGVRVTLEVTPDCPVAATVIWIQDSLAGIAFVEPIDVVAALRGGRDGPYRRVARTPRLQVRRTATLCSEDVEREVMLHDVSLNGARIATDAMLAPDAEVAIFAKGLAPLSGRIRWCRDNLAGMEFDVPMKVDVLADWVGMDKDG